MSQQEQKLINQAKARFPNPDSYPSKYCAPHIFVEKKRVLFKKVFAARRAVDPGVAPQCCKWEYVEILPIVNFGNRTAERKNYDTLY